jgi:hypothetical protein
MLGHAQNSSTFIFTLHTVQDVCIAAEAVLLFHGQTRIVCVYAVVGVVVLEAVFCRHAIHAYIRHHARMHVCLSVSNTADNPASHSIAKEQFRTICHESGAQWPQQSPCVWIMSIAGVGSLRAAVVSSR